MGDIEDLVKRYELGEDEEHVIVPYRDKDGRQKKRYLLKRKFIRIVYTEGHFVDFPFGDVVEATVRYPHLPLSEALYRRSTESE